MNYDQVYTLSLQSSTNDLRVSRFNDSYYKKKFTILMHRSGRLDLADALKCTKLVLYYTTKCKSKIPKNKIRVILKVRKSWHQPIVMKNTNMLGWIKTIVCMY